MMALKAHGVDVDEDTVNKVMGAQPMRGASWENAIAAAQHFGFRVHMVVPATVKMLKEWTDQGIPVMIAWNPEGREWSHASLVYDVREDGTVYVADPNCPDPEQTTRKVSSDDFYHKWFEKWPDYLVRRPAMAIEREITPEGRQMVASQKTAAVPQVHQEGIHNQVDQAFVDRLRHLVPEMIHEGSPTGGLTVMTEDYASGDVYVSPEKSKPGWYLLIGEKVPVGTVISVVGQVQKVAKSPTPVQPKKKTDNKVVVEPSKPRSDAAKALAQRGGAGSGVHKNREDDFEKGRTRKPKHKKDWTDKEASDRLADRYLEK